MTDIFKQTDTFRLSVETQAARVDAAKARLVQESENALINKLYTIYGNGTLTGESTANLEQVESHTSDSVTFDGTISVSAQVVDGGKKTISIPVSVKANQLDYVTDAELKQMISEITAEETKTEYPSIEAAVIEASLSDFSLIDDGSDYLKVFHPSLDTGRELGVISKDEYTKSSDKQALLTSVLSNSVKNTGVEAEHDLKFVGSFSEPTITVEAQEEAPLFTDEITEENVVEATEDTVYLSHQADSYRQAVESDEQVRRASFEKVASQATNSLVSYLQGLNYGGVKVLSTDTSNDTFVSVTASLFDNVGEKVVTFSLPIRDSLYTLPQKEAVHTLIAETVDLKTQIASEFEKETLEHLTAIDELEAFNAQETEAAIAEERIEKTASTDSGGTQFVGPVDVLHIDKHTLGLPDDTEIGAKAYVDGYWWQLTSKDKNNLGKEADSGSIWTFTKVAPEKGEPEVKL